MTQVIPAVEVPQIEHGLLLQLDLQNENFDAALPATGQNGSNPQFFTYYISNCWKNITWEGNEFIALAGFLQVTEMQHDIQATNNEISISLSAIPAEYITSILGAQVKGGKVKIWRVFFDYATQEVKQVAGEDQIFLRFDGVISNYSVNEDVTNDIHGGEVSHTITVVAANHLGIIENRVVGRRTNQKNYQTEYGDLLITVGTGSVSWGPAVLTSNITTDPCMNKVASLHNASFDFGKETE